MTTSSATWKSIGKFSNLFFESTGTTVPRFYWSQVDGEMNENERRKGDVF